MPGDAWLRARELKRAISPLSAAANIDTKGDIWIRVAQIHLEREEWLSASKALGNALKKGKLTDTGNAHLLMGIASYRAKKVKVAKKSFESALKFKNTEKSAKQWLKVLRQKKPT
jgi:Tfp pilus assembly protein PilF